MATKDLPIIHLIKASLLLLADRESVGCFHLSKCGSYLKNVLEQELEKSIPNFKLAVTTLCEWYNVSCVKIALGEVFGCNFDVFKFKCKPGRPQILECIEYLFSMTWVGVGV